MNEPQQQIENIEFLANTEWRGAEVVPLSADMGARSYYRLSQGGKTALLMDMSGAEEYEAGLKAYVDIAEYLKTSGARTPEIYSHDIASGLALIEDLGGQSFGDALREGGVAADVYVHATEALVEIKRGAVENTLGLKGYKDTLIYERLSQFVEYYVPLATDDVVGHKEILVVLAEIESALPPCPLGFCHADYHLENLMWLGHKDAPYAVIDFQDAFWGFQGYDLLNLLEDARATVPNDIKAAMKALYCAGMGDAEMQAFEDWYVLLSCHFHLRVLGLFIKFSQDNGTTEFLSHIPRLQDYLKANLENPVMTPLKKWLEDKNISFNIKLDELLKKS